jgi:hypothetical protein
MLLRYLKWNYLGKEEEGKEKRKKFKGNEIRGAVVKTHTLCSKDPGSNLGPHTIHCDSGVLISSSVSLGRREDVCLP